MDYSKIGHHLKLVRERKGLSYEQIFEITRIQPSVLKDIEDGRPGISSVFLRGFIRSYARALAVDPEPLFEKMKQEARKIENERKKSNSGPDHEDSSKKSRRFKWLALALMAGIVLSLFWIFPGKNREEAFNQEEGLIESVEESKPSASGKKVKKPPAPAEKTDLLKGNVSDNSLFSQIKNSVFKEELVIQSPEPLRIYFKLDQQSAVTKDLEPGVWFPMKARKRIYLRFDEKKGDVQIFYNGQQVSVGESSFFERVFQP